MENTQNNKQKKDIKIDIKGMLKVVGLLYAVLILVGILTYVLKAGEYDTEMINGKLQIIPGTYHILTENPTRIPWFRWIIAPIETLLFDSSKGTMYQVIGMILVLGGCFKVLQDSGCLPALVKLLIKNVRKRRFQAIWIINAAMCILSSCFGIQDHLLILFPIFLSLADAMHWKKTTALSLVLITTSIGFTCALFNPFTVGICVNVAGVSILDGIWYRLLMLVILYIASSIFLVNMAKKDEKSDDFVELTDEEIAECTSMSKEEKTKAWIVIGLFSFVLLIVILFSSIPALVKLNLGLIIMAVAFFIGTIVIGLCLLKSGKLWIKSFLKGMGDVAPSLFVIVTAFSIKYIADQGKILHTIFYYITSLVEKTNPKLGVIVLLVFILILEFFIPSGSAKAALIMPILTLGTIPGLSTNVIILTYLLGDGFTNVIYPTCGTLMIGLGIAGVSLPEWYKKTMLFNLFLFGTSCLFLILAVIIGL